MANRFDLVPNQEQQDSKIEVYLKNEGRTPSDEMELNLVNVFVNMKKLFRLYAWIMLFTFVTGLLVPYLMILFQKSSADSVSAVINFEYEGASGLKAPDGSNLDVGFIKNSYIISEALRNSHLSKDISINSVSSNVSISRMLSQETRQQLEIMEKLNSSSNNSSDPQKYIDVVNGVNYTYKNQYIIKLENGFGSQDKPVYLDGEELAILLNSIIDSYQSYFFQKFDNFVLPDNSIDDISLDELDYIEWLDNMNDILDNLSRYCTSSVKAEYRNYRSTIDGLSFADINRMINLIKTIRVDYLYSYLYYNSITKDKDKILTRFNYTKRNLDHSLNSVLENIKNGEDLITGYKNNNIIISRLAQSQEDGEATSLTSTSITDYYNSLILKQADFYTEKTNLELQLDNINDKIQGYTNAKNTSSSISVVENEITEVNDICRQLYDLTKKHAEEIIKGEAYKNSFMSKINASFYGGFFATDNIKKIIIGGVIGLLIGFILWFGHSFIKEWKDADAKAKV